MSETSIATARGGVYYLDTATKGWKSVDGGLSRIDIYHDSARKTYRVVAMGKTQAVVINSPIFKELDYIKSSDTFHSWNDGKIAYGLNFASAQEANSFATSMADCVVKLKEAANIQPTLPPPAPATNRSSLTYSQPPVVASSVSSSSLNLSQPYSPYGAPTFTPTAAPTYTPTPSPAPSYTPAPTPTPTAAVYTPSPAPPSNPAPGPPQSSIRPGAPPPPPPPPKSPGKTASPTVPRMSLAEQLANKENNLKKVETPPETAILVTPATGGESGTAPVRPHPIAPGEGRDMMGELAARIQRKQQAAAAREEGAPAPVPPARTPSPTPPPNSTPTPTPSTAKPAQVKMVPRKPGANLAPAGLVHSASAPSPAAGASTDQSDTITLTRAELAAFRQEIIDSVRRELAAAKQDILQGLGK